ncbi:MAG: hypothetical protein WC595_02075 [Candidatus Nanoarchaeia archaeon]
MVKVIEFLGLSRAGKSTQQKRVIRELQGRGYVCEPFVRPKFGFKEAGSVENFHLRFFEEMRTSYESARTRQLDYFVFDRGFYDRIAMLTKDQESGKLSTAGVESLRKELEVYTKEVAHAVLFLVSPETSYGRWAAQRAEGLDNGVFYQGLDDEENVFTLRREHDLYRRMNAKYPHLVEINGELEKETITGSLLEIIGIKEAYKKCVGADEKCTK